MTFDITRSKRLLHRLLQFRTASILCGVIILTPLANVASAADPKAVLDTILGTAIPVLQDTMASISQGCSGGAHGVPPVPWNRLRPHGDSAVNAFSAARTALATSQIPVAVQQINSGLSELDQLIDGLHDNCSGGAHGVDPVYYGRYVGFRNDLKTQLQTALRFL